MGQLSLSLMRPPRTSCGHLPDSDEASRLAGYAGSFSVRCQSTPSPRVLRVKRARRLSTHFAVVLTKRFWISVTLGLALVLGQVGGYAHVLTHLQDLAQDGKTVQHSKTCPFDTPYAQLASGLAHTVLPVLVCVKPNDALPTTPQPCIRSALTLLPFARAPPSQS
jgi:hypothetical protein